MSAKDPNKFLFWTLTPLNARRVQNFKANRRGYWSMWIFGLLFILSLFAELLAYDKPILVNYKGSYYTPIWNFYPEIEFGGEEETEAQYRDPEVQCLILTGGLIDPCFDDPDATIEDAQDGEFEGETLDKGWALWPLIPYSFDTAVDRPGSAPLSPNVVGFYEDDAGESRFGLLPSDQRGQNLLGTRKQTRCSGTCDPWVSFVHLVYLDGNRCQHSDRCICRGDSRLFWRLAGFDFPAGN